MPPIQHIFLDDGDVINDNTLRGPQWQRLVGEFFAPRLGGEPSAWAAANASIAEEADARFVPRIRAGCRYSEAHLDFEADWLRSMCRVVEVEAPQGEACAALAHEASKYITRRVRAAYPGAVEAIRALGQRYELFTASNEHSTELQGYLEGMGVASLFRGFYGPDLIDAMKFDKLYYQRMFEHAGVDPAACLVVDDKAEFLAAAASMGARTVQVSRVAPAPAGSFVIEGLAALPPLLASGRLLE